MTSDSVSEFQEKPIKTKAKITKKTKARKTAAKSSTKDKKPISDKS